MPIKDKDNKTIGIFYVGASQKFIDELQNSIEKQIIITFLIIVIVLFILIYIFSKKVIISPIVNLTASLKDISHGDGDLTVKLPEKEKGDELNELSHWFNIFIEKIREIIEQISNESKVLASSSEELNISSKEMTKQIERTNKETKEANNLIENANEKGLSIASAVEENAATIGEVSNAMNKTNSVTQETINSISQISSLIDESPKNIKEVNSGSNIISNNTKFNI